MVFATAAKFTIEPVTDFVFLATCFQIIQFTLVPHAQGGDDHAQVEYFDLGLYAPCLHFFGGAIQKLR